MPAAVNSALRGPKAALPGIARPANIPAAPSDSLHLIASMTPDQWAILTLIFYALAGVGLQVWRAIRCPEGWRFWELYLLSRLWATTIFGQRIQQRCPFPMDGPALILANHRSPVDPLLILAASAHKTHGFGLRVMEFLTAREYCEMPGAIGWLCGVMKSIPVERDGKDMGPAKFALRKLRAGRLVGIFPEGRLNTGDGLLPFNEGVAWLALRSGAPVYPMFVHNAPQEGTMVTPFYTVCETAVTFGEPIDLSQYEDCRMTQPLLQEVSEFLRGQLASVGGIRPPVDAETDENDHPDPVDPPAPRVLAG